MTIFFFIVREGQDTGAGTICFENILKVVKSAVFSYFYPSFTTFGIRTPFLLFERFIFVS